MFTKTCPRCNEPKELNQFYSYLSRKGDRKTRKHCIPCSKKIQEEWQESKGTTLTEYHAKWHATRVKKDPQICAKQKMRKWELKLGLEAGWYPRMFVEQNGLCAICKKPESTKGTRKHFDKSGKRFAIDHCHERNIPRGLLCMSCNTRLAVLEDADFVAKAQAYLKQYP